MGVELAIVKMEKKTYRFTLPVICHDVNWITGDDPIAGLLLMGSASRCKLLPATEIDNHDGLRSLRDRIAEQSRSVDVDPLEFNEDHEAVLSLRLTQVGLSRHGTGWRFTLPPAVASLMGMLPGSEIAVLIVDGCVEFWNVEALRAAGSFPLTDLS